MNRMPVCLLCRKRCGQFLCPCCGIHTKMPWKCDICELHTEPCLAILRLHDEKDRRMVKALVILVLFILAVVLAKVLS